MLLFQKSRIRFHTSTSRIFKIVTEWSNPLPKQFLKALHSYNLAFQFTSFGVNKTVKGNFMPTFKIQGQVCHVVGVLQLVNNNVPKFLKVYLIVDYLQEAQMRVNHIR